MQNIDNTRDDLLTNTGKAMLQDRYLLAGETPQNLFWRVASHYSNDPAHAQRLYDYISKLWFMPATPILSNGGTKRGLPISCNLNQVEDTMDSIANINYENLHLAKNGAGVATDFSKVRSIGEPINNNGTSSGIMPFIKMLDSQSLAVSQGGTRGGAMATYLHISHPEIEEFIDVRRPVGDQNRRSLNIHHGIVINDAFMRAIEKDEKWQLKKITNGEVMHKVSARDLWAKILTARVETGEPYIVFEDNANKTENAYPEIFKALDLKVEHSNLCVAPETLILTSNGWQEIQSCADKKTTIWNGFEWSEVVPVKTGENQQLITIETNDSQELTCTEYHKWYIQTQNTFGGISKIICKRTHELNVGDKIIKYNFPVIEGTIDLPYAYANGFYSGDGCQLQNGKSRIYLYHEKRKCETRLSVSSCNNIATYIQPKQNRKYIDLPCGILEYKFFVPNADYTITSRLQWFAGLCDSDGCITRNGANQSLQIASINKQFLLNIQKMLQELGCNSKIAMMRNAGKYLMPKNDGTGGNAYYNCQNIYRILIDSNELYKIISLGLNFERLDYTLHLPQRKASQFIQITKIIKNGRISDTYCFTEPKRNMAVFNGILTGNCSEIMLPTHRDYNNIQRTAICCLSSLNLEKYLEWEGNGQFLKDILYFLDNVLNDYIKKAPEQLKNAVYSAIQSRTIGLGVMGFHSFLQSQNVAFEGVMAKSWNKRIFKYIKETCDKFNVEIGEERGEPEDFIYARKHGKYNGKIQRFATMFAVAPTASISNICGESSPGIEPYAANAFLQKTKSGSFTIQNKNLKKLLQAKGKDNSEVWSSITTTNGSVQHLDFLTPEEKAVFKTSFEIDQKWVIEHSADRTPYICQGQSVNLFFAANVSKKVLNKIHFDAWKKGLKSLYYCRSRSIQRADQVSQVTTTDKINVPSQDTEECLSCQ